MRTSTRQADTLPAGPPSATRAEAAFVTPYGVGRLTFAGDLPLALDLPEPGRERPGGPSSRRLTVRQAAWVDSVERYFAGEPVTFDLDVAAHCRLRGLTAFESDVYAALARVPYGRAVSYRDLAHAAGRPLAYRAVGSAMARNTLPVILPCHRVIRNDGTPGEYGDDPAWKVRLLRLEGVLAPGAVRVAAAGVGRT